jgi:hypothetical protein
VARSLRASLALSVVDAYERLVDRLHREGVRFVIIGLSGANYYARSARALFLTQDRDLFLPPDPDNTLAAWRACEALNLHLFRGDEPLDRSRDRFRAERVVANPALTSATDGAGLDVDFTFVMAGFDFERAWKRRRVFRVGKVRIPVARLADIVESKRRAGRYKDRLFLATHAEAVRDLMELERGRRARQKPRRTRRR